MSKRYIFLVGLLIVALSIMLAACNGATPTEEAMDDGLQETEAPADDMADDDMADDMMMDLSGVTIVFWHPWGESSNPIVNETMTALIADFNATNEYGITVEGYDQGSHSDVEDAVNAAIQSGDLPNISVGYTTTLATWHDVGAAVDFDQFIYDPDYGLSEDQLADLLPGALEAGQSAMGVQVGYPISRSANVMYYNNSFAQDLGFDAMPTNFAEFKEQICAATEYNATDDNPDNDGTGGLVLYASASNFMTFLQAFGADVINATGDGYDFTKDAIKEMVLAVKDIYDSDCTFETDSYPNPEFADRSALVTMSSTAGLPYQVAAFEDIGSTDEWSFMAFPGATGDGAVTSYAQMLGILSSTPEKELASWLFIKYLTSPESQAQWIEASQYYPTQGATEALLGDFISANPIWSTGIVLGNVAAVEPPFTSWQSVRRAIGDAFPALLQAEDDAAIDALLLDLTDNANTLYAELDMGS
jgi:multiple sugar transport system substrate-binding protein/sn-glycerol 3-phosphate transport system substrate-binding protein